MAQASQVRGEWRTSVADRDPCRLLESSSHLRVTDAAGRHQDHGLIHKTHRKAPGEAQHHVVVGSDAVVQIEFAHLAIQLARNEQRRLGNMRLNQFAAPRER